MTIADEIERLQALHANGSLTDSEFAQAKATVLARYATASQSDRTNLRDLDEIHFQNELARLDREWALERERFMVSGRYGTRSIPAQGMSLLAVLFIAGFGLFWTISAATMGAPGFFPLFGIIFIVFGIGFNIHSFIKASAYKQAEHAYQRRRAHLLAQHPATSDGLFQQGRF